MSGAHARPDYQTGGRVFEFDEPVLASAYEDEVGREHVRPPKRNNVKRKISMGEQQAIDRRKREAKEKKCPKCKANYDRTVLDERTREVVCQSCGTVVDRVFDVGVYDARRLRPAVVTDPPANYFNERMAQWSCQEPPIPMVDRRRLVDTYNEGYGPYSSRESGLFYDPFLYKPTVRQIIIDAGLSPKQYCEKWLTIRRMLGAEPHPVPSDELVRELKRLFAKVNAAWPRVQQQFKRTSRPNYNFVIRQLLLLVGVEHFAKHEIWFPSVSNGKHSELMQQWAAICVVNDWKIYEPEWQDGKVRRKELKRIDQVFKYDFARRHCGCSLASQALRAGAGQEHKHDTRRSTTCT